MIAHAFYFTMMAVAGLGVVLSLLFFAVILSLLSLAVIGWSPRC